MTTRLSLAEQIQRQYKRAIGSEESTKAAIDRREIYPLIDQVTNELLAIEINSSIKVGNTVIPSCALATYGNIEVKHENGRHYISLPVHPISLPRNMGVYSVVPQTGVLPYDGDPYIPITQEDWDLLSVSDMNDSGMLEGYVAFYVEGRKVFFTKSPSAIVKIKLVVSEPSLIGDNEAYPISPEMESSVILKVLDILKSNTGQQQGKPQDR